MALHKLYVAKRRELWVTVAYGPLKGEAKVYEIPDGTGPDYMGYGIYPGSRISKLQIRYGAEVLLEWDRGGDRELPAVWPANYLADIVAQLDALPTTHSAVGRVLDGDRDRGE